MKTVMQDAFERAGGDYQMSRLKALLAKLSQTHKGLALDNALYVEAKKDRALLLALCRYYRLHEMPGEGHAFAAAGGQLGSADAQQPNGDGKGLIRHADHARSEFSFPSPTNRERASHITRADKAPLVLPAAREQSAASRRMAIVVNSEISASLLDSFKVRGKVIGDLTLRELSAIEATNMREAALIGRIRAYCGPEPDLNKPVRHYISNPVLTGMIAGVNSHAA